MFNLLIRKEKQVVRGTCTAYLYLNNKVMLIKKYENLDNAEKFVKDYIRDMYQKGYKYEGMIEEVL